ncbi:hypothetical protein EGW08_022604 [Elysia chlorotica]|uniref:Serine/threonine specific protein phosphatases domain-containing protein n=1 Tax=Elysia chlorotica TaxID=188477 RepID=A0A3S0Z304_ELYCH|nr:hypothetical protein EGW08_022604 [Elysia chlorotica]
MGRQNLTFGAARVATQRQGGGTRTFVSGSYVPQCWVARTFFSGSQVPQDDVPFPLQYRLTAQDVFEGAGVPNLACLRRHFHGEGRLDLDCLLRIVRDTRAALARESNVVYLSGTIRVVGAICGQFYDLLEILKRVNFDEGEKCVFLGNFSWDGSFNTETVLYLYAHKLVYPDHVILLRSQRETRLCSKTTFKLECETKYSLDVYEDFCQSFDHLPLVAIINKYTMCVHGGISPKALDLAHIDAINRFEEPPPRGAMTDLLWADPDPNFGQEAPTTPCFTFNRDRLISVFFTCEALKHFMKRNRLTCLIRANQPLFDGFSHLVLLTVSRVTVCVLQVFLSRVAHRVTCDCVSRRFVEYQMPVQAKDEHKYSMKGVFSAPNFKGKRNQGKFVEYQMPVQAKDEHKYSMKGVFSAPNFKGKRNQGK